MVCLYPDVVLEEPTQLTEANTTFQPPKKRGGSSSAAAATTPKRPKARQSKLAKENDVSGEEETEIKEVFHLFSTSHEDFPDEKEGVIPREDVRKALVYGHPSSLPLSPCHSH